ncbi:sla2 Src-like adaptor 2 [Balamuthia mandrillaris]
MKPRTTTMEKVQTHVTGRINVFNSDKLYKVTFPRALYKATESKELQPKTKHIRRLVLETHNVHGGVSFYREVAKRPVFKDQVVCWRALNCIHRVMMDGHPKVLKDSAYEMRMFEDLRANWARARDMGGYGVLNVAYIDFLISKIRFHNKHPVFDGNISLEAFLRKTNNRLPDHNTSFEMIAHLLDHQENLLKFEKLIFAHRELLNELEVFALIPCVLESYAIYSVITYFMKQLINSIDNMELFDFLAKRYYAQYMDLRDFYFKANNIQAITRVIPVPMLPVDPPQFAKPRQRGGDRQRRKRAPSKKRREDEENGEHEQPQPQPKVQQAPSLFDLPLEPRSNQATGPQGWTTFASPFARPLIPQPAFVPQPQPMPQPPLNPFADDSDLRKENEALKKRVAELEEQNRFLLTRNAQLEREKAELKDKIANLIEEHDEERRSRMLNELDGAYKMVDTLLFDLDSPANAGNANATTQILMDSSHALAQEISRLLESVASGDETKIREAIQAVINRNRDLLNNAKGLSYLTENPELRELILKMAREAGGSVAELLNELVNSVENMEDWRDIKDLAARSDIIRRILAELEKVAGRVEEEQTATSNEPQEDLEELAEQELLAAARVIEQAAKDLMAARARPRPKELPEGAVDVAGPILDAATAITDAAARLVAAATESQKERVRQGKLPNNSSVYKRDPTWSEGLISAAKFVAMAVSQLVGAASKTVEGSLDDAGLIAASRAVAQATAQLVAASKAKADPFSKNQEHLVRASGLVRTATEKLVEAARAAAAKQDSEAVSSMNFNSMSSTAYKVARMNQAQKIIELERELQKQNEVMRKMNEAEYRVQKNVLAEGQPGFEKQLQE